MIITIAGIGLAWAASFFFSTLWQSLRRFSRPRLGEYLESHGWSDRLMPIINNSADLLFIMALGRLVFNLLILLEMLWLFDAAGRQPLHYLWAACLALVATVSCSVILPGAAARTAAEQILGLCAPLLLWLRLAMLPVLRIRGAIDTMMNRAAGEGDQIEHDILSAVEEGEKEGVVDKQEREMIQSVIEFRDTQCGQIMTARPQIVALPLDSSLAKVKQTLEESGYSRIPVYEGTLDHVIGILYARDLLKHIGQPPEQFDIRSAARSAVYIPQTKPLRDLLQEFRMQKVHIAIVLDEYGGTAGMVTIEDILEELVGDITDEHEPQEPTLLKRLDEHAWEADARMELDELNRRLGLALPEDAGYNTLGGFISNTLGRIPPAGTQFEHQGTRLTVLSAEPAKVKNVKIEMARKPGPQEAEGRR